MRLLRSASFAAALVLVALPARANVTFNVSNVITTGGALAGSFTTNDALNSVISFSITTPATATFSAFSYNASTATVSASTLPSQYFRIDTPGNVDELQFYFSTGLTSAGGTLLSTNSYEHQQSGGNRFLSGTVTAVVPTAVPEPASLVVLGVAAAGLAAARRRRTR